MLKERVARAVITLAPGLARAVITRSAQSGGKLGDHWLVDEVAPTLFPEAFPYRIGGISLWLPTAARHYYRRFEPQSRRIFEQVVRRGDRVVDVGANAGYYTLLASQLVGPSGHIFTVEPSPVTARIVRRNIANRDNVTLFEVAAGERRATASFTISADSLNDAFVPGPYSPTVGAVSVQVSPLDDLIAPPVDVIKMDIQGHEPAALNGMSKLIRDSPRLTILVEWAPACLTSAGYPAECLPHILQGYGFAIKSLIPHTEDREIPFSEAIHEIQRNPTTREYWNIVAVKGQ